MNVLIISGFLGAGKTTLIQHLLTSQSGEFGKIALIVNEVGTVGVDGELLSGQDVDMLELTSGCICCSIKGDFTRAVEEIHTRVNPDFLIVEATGVAQPGDILESFFDSDIQEFSQLRGLIVVVDADMFEVKEMLGTFYENQIFCADTIILNKIDLVGEGGLNDINHALREMNPKARIIPSEYCRVETSSLLEGYSKGGEAFDHSHHTHKDLHEWGFQTFSFESEERLDRSKVIEFLESLPSTLFRLKGWVKFQDSGGLIDFVAGRHRIEPIEKDHPNALSFIGRNCDPERILAELDRCKIKGSERT